MAEHKTSFTQDTGLPAYTRADAFHRGIDKSDMDDRLGAIGERHTGDIYAVAAPGPEPLEPPLVVMGPRSCAHHIDGAERARLPLWIVAQAAPQRLQAITQVLVQYVRISGGRVGWRLLEADAVDSQNAQLLPVSHEIPPSHQDPAPAAPPELIVSAEAQITPSCARTPQL